MQGEGLAAFDSRAEYCKELTHLRRAIDVARMEDNYERWYKLLISYYFTLKPRMQKKKGDMSKTNEDYYKQVKEKYHEWKLAVMKKKKSLPLTHFDIFEEWEMELRICENNLGLLMPDRDDPAFALSGGNY